MVVRVSSAGRMAIGARIVQVFRPILVSTVVTQGIGQRTALLLLPLQVRGNRRIVKAGTSEREREISTFCRYCGLWDLSFLL